MQYHFAQIESKWQSYWEKNQSNLAENNFSKPKFYVLDMFPYPSGAGLHVGHPLGYIASDIFSRYMRLKGFNVLHPMGYDAFGLPAEQYALEHKIHPAEATNKNIKNFRRQLKKIGLSFDWSRELRTDDPNYYKWTQWLFIQLFNSYFDRKLQKACAIESLVETFKLEGNKNHPCPSDESLKFNAQEWHTYTYKTQHDILMQYRLMYAGQGEVNWCEALGTVLANDEVENGFSKRGSHPIERKKLRQWNLRITEYAERLLEGLEQIHFSNSLKDMQTNWIGKSIGANIHFKLNDNSATLRVFTTRPDTIFGVDFMVIAPEHELISKITTPEQKKDVDDYIKYCKSKTDLDRQKEKKITGCFTGAYCLHPINNTPIPIWISEYVLIGYGTGAIMAVPCGDERDFNFAQHFNLNITNILGNLFDGKTANPTKDAILCNSDFCTGKNMSDATLLILEKLEAIGSGYRKINYKMRDAAFSRQRYWGEPIPIKWINDCAMPLTIHELPLILPELQHYELDKNGNGVLAQIPSWNAQNLETLTMPGAAGSSWYFLRFMDPNNAHHFASKDALSYWQQVDLYIGGTEHATGHLMYSRMWTHVLYDLDYIPFNEPFKKLINQGMIQAFSWFCYVDNHDKCIYPYHLVPFINKPLKRLRIHYADKFFAHPGRLDDHGKIHEQTKLDFLNNIHKKDYKLVGFDTDMPEHFDSHKGFDFESQIDKMSKSKYNVVNPDDVIEHYGTDTFRLYEMFLGPIEQSKPWDTKGIEGVSRFLKKVWRLFIDELSSQVIVNQDEPTIQELKILHKTIKKITDDIERFSMNTAVSNFMVCINELSDLKCHKKQILEPFLILLAPFAPHICEELWELCGHNQSIFKEQFPVFNTALVEDSQKEYPISINGKLRAHLLLSLSLTPEEVEIQVLALDIVKKWLNNNPPKKFIFVKNKMVNIVL